MIVNSFKDVREWRFDPLKIVFTLLGGLIFMAVARWLFSFDSSITDQHLLVFGLVVNGLLACLPIQRVVAYYERKERVHIYIYTKIKDKEEFNFRESKNATTKSTLINLVITGLSLVGCTLFSLHFYNYEVFGVNGQLVLSALIAQINLPTQLTLLELSQGVIKGLILMVSLSLSITVNLPFLSRDVHVNTHYIDESQT
jgi:hypothetical protein